jgi:uncharacterized protein (DUF2336 family)
MTAQRTVIPGLDGVTAGGDPERKARAIQKLGRLFAEGAAVFSDAHVAVFDQVLTDLIPRADTAVRAELAMQMASLPNAPPGLIAKLVQDNALAVCGPILSRSSVVDDTTLIEIARLKGQSHLLAIATRPLLSAGLTDIIVRRGERDVVRVVAGNSGATFSDSGYTALIKRAGQDGPLSLTIGQRRDLSDTNLQKLLSGSVEIVRRRLIATLPQDRRASLAPGSAPAQSAATRYDFAPAQKAILALHKAGRLNENVVLEAAAHKDYETMVAALSGLSGTPLATIDHLLRGERYDPVLVLGRAIGLDWSIVQAVIGTRPHHAKLSGHALEDARQNFERLLRSTAVRALGFWCQRTPSVA